MNCDPEGLNAPLARPLCCPASYWISWMLRTGVASLLEVSSLEPLTSWSISLYCMYIIIIPQSCVFTAVIMFLIAWSFTLVSLALASLIYYYVSIKGKAGDWGDGFKSAYFQLVLHSSIF
ncbi:Cation-chloride cotransporter 1 [Artemisia annua]|uniref:Cation-chloride cotransporter 1 n=1 Tax=Artemisia annua TaxID=35608 RepID=A0A2U1KJI0_ARTAN|nr:Cation-chloride cotransporter 1 [Artemisia annua]